MIAAHQYLAPVERLAVPNRPQMARPAGAANPGALSALAVGVGEAPGRGEIAAQHMAHPGEIAGHHPAHRLADDAFLRDPEARRLRVAVERLIEPPL